MIRVEYGDFYSVVKKEVDEASFNRYMRKANRVFENLCMTVDGVNKLRDCTPTDEETIETIKDGICELMAFMFGIDEAERSQSEAYGYETVNGAMRGKVIGSISTGSESISYTQPTAKSSFDVALADRAQRDTIYNDIAEDFLRGLYDKNGVSLLYSGIYLY